MTKRERCGTHHIFYPTTGNCSECIRQMTRNDLTPTNHCGKHGVDYDKKAGCPQCAAEE
jgi:hypothetical protein